MFSGKRAGLVTLLIAAFVFLIQAVMAGGQDPAIKNSAKGKAVFMQNCAACHTIGQGDLVGPDLLGVTRIRSHSWLMQTIQRPDLMLEKKDPTTIQLLKKYNGIPMPDQHITAQEAAWIISYIESASAAQKKSKAK